jgi:hypothetical protein
MVEDQRSIYKSQICQIRQHSFAKQAQNERKYSWSSFKKTAKRKDDQSLKHDPDPEEA